jgi:hypothetical protein
MTCLPKNSHTELESLELLADETAIDFLSHTVVYDAKNSEKIVVSNFGTRGTNIYTPSNLDIYNFSLLSDDLFHKRINTQQQRNPMLFNDKEFRGDGFIK